MTPRLAAAVFLALAACACSARAQVPDWRLIWNDEFDGPAGAVPDRSKWIYDAGRGQNGWGNHELEFYCSPGADAPCDIRRPNATLDGEGHLALEARKNPAGEWTSARLKTKGLAEFQYVRVEARLKLPVGAGLWPAFWMIGRDGETAGWPDCGEIDIMENVPPIGPSVAESTVHGPGYSSVHGIGRGYAFPNGGRVDDGFHIYGALWSPGEIAFYVDDWTRPFLTVTPKDLPAERRWVFDHPFYLILNLAVGGDWPGPPDALTPDPARLLVDYVRVYRN